MTPAGRAAPGAYLRPSEPTTPAQVAPLSLKYPQSVSLRVVVWGLSPLGQRRCAQAGPVYCPACVSPTPNPTLHVLSHTHP